MRFYFQYGEFLSNGSSWLDLAVQFLGIVVGAGISILVFQLGKRHENKKEKTRLNDLAIYIKSAIESLVSPLTKQTESLQTFSNQLTEKRDIDYAPQTIVTLHSKSIRWISHEDLHKIFVATNALNKSDNSNRLRLFNSDLDYIESVSSDLNEIMSMFMNKKDKYVDEYNVNMKQISVMKDRIWLEYNTIFQRDNTFKYQFFIDLDKLMAEWSSKENFTEHDIAYENFLVPLQKLCRSSQPDNNTFILLNLSNECIYALTNLAALKAFIKDAVDFKIKKLISIQENLDSFKDHYWPKDSKKLTLKR